MDQKFDFLLADIELLGIDSSKRKLLEGIVKIAYLKGGIDAYDKENKKLDSILKT